MRYWRCKECGAVVWQEDLLLAPHPFDDDEEISGCPTCRSADCFVGLCEHVDCTRDGNCGAPTVEGYKWLCGEHFREVNKQVKE